ncbi:MAG: serine racemase VanT catalytic subunit, partial [Lachnospiraceae bacterium]|nr:serine racemase VanT catalytic subunit [Lachnospiraceae bacterium]
KEALIVGRICMDQMLVDVTGIEDVKCGDIATIMGSAGKKEITAYDLAEMEGTITNEILSRMGNRLNRIVV